MDTFFSKDHQFGSTQMRKIKEGWIGSLRSVSEFSKEICEKKIDTVQKFLSVPSEKLPTGPDNTRVDNLILTAGTDRNIRF